MQLHQRFIVNELAVAVAHVKLERDFFELHIIIIMQDDQIPLPLGQLLQSIRQLLQRFLVQNTLERILFYDILVAQLVIDLPCPEKINQSIPSNGINPRGHGSLRLIKGSELLKIFVKMVA